jgi:hypothetical protein
MWKIIIDYVKCQKFPNLEMAADLIGKAAFAILDGIQG